MVLARVLQSQEERTRRHQSDLAEARNALTQLQGVAIDAASSAVALLTVDVAPGVVRDLLDTSTGLVRNHVMSPFVGAAADAGLREHSQRVIRAGRPKRTVYDAAVLDDPRSRDRLTQWAETGEDQRIGWDLPTEFCVFGAEAVVAVASWGDPSSDYVIVRHPMLVAAFTSLFDHAWAEGYPLRTSEPEADGIGDGPLLELLARGLKDEAIARYLGWSLRTVRRRIARLMTELGARTRFQLGAQAARAGHLGGDLERRAPAPAPRPRQVGDGRGSR